MDKKKLSLKRVEILAISRIWFKKIMEIPLFFLFNSEKIADLINYEKNKTK